MWFRRVRNRAFFLILILPVMVTMMLVGGVNLGFFVALQDSQEQSNRKALEELRLIATANSFNRDMDLAQDLAGAPAGGAG